MKDRDREEDRDRERDRERDYERENGTNGEEQKGTRGMSETPRPYGEANAGDVERDEPAPAHDDLDTAE